MTWALFKANIKSARTIWLIMALVFVLYFAIILSMYDPESTEKLNQMLEMFPDALIKALGLEQVDETLLSFVTTYMYGVQLLLYPMAVSMVVNHRLVAAHVDKGSMAYFLSTPNSRSKIVVTQAAFSLVSMATFFTTVTVCSLALSEIMYPGAMDVGGFILLNIYAMFMYFAIGGIGFLASCIAHDSGISLGIGIGIPLGFLVFQMVGDAGVKFAWLSKLSLYSLYQPDKIIVGDTVGYFGMLAFLVISALLYGTGVWIFNRRDFHV